MVVLFYPDISNFTFWNVKNLKCKIFLIDFLDELGNFKQKKFTLQNVKFFYILNQQTHGHNFRPFYYFGWYYFQIAQRKNCQILDFHSVGYRDHFWPMIGGSMTGPDIHNRTLILIIMQ